MAFQKINVGAAPNDGTGDKNRDAFIKVNANFADAQAQINSTQLLTIVMDPPTKIAAGGNPTAGLTGAFPTLHMQLGLVDGSAGAGAPTSPDILAIAEMARLERSLAAAGIPDEPSLILDFVRGVHFASKGAITASIATLIASLPGSSFTRGSTATYFDSDGLMKTAATGVPRVEYDPVTRSPKGLLLEPAGTNQALRSSNFSTTWTLVGGNVTAGVATAPDGTVSMTSLIEDTGNTQHSLRQSSLAVTSGTTYTFSIFASERANANKRYLILLLQSGQFGADSYITADLATGTFTTTGVPVAAGMIPVGGGIYRIWVAATATGTGSTQAAYFISNSSSGSVGSYAGDGTSGFNIWGAQFEAGGSPSSYIPTVASAVARAADNYALAVPAGLLSLTAGTFLTEFDVPLAPPSNQAPARLQGSDQANSAQFSRNVSGSGSILANANGSNVIATTGGMAWPASGPVRAAAKYNAGNLISRSWLGAAATTTPSSTFTSFGSLTQVVPAGILVPCYLRRFLYWPVALGDSKLQAAANLSAWS